MVKQKFQIELSRQKKRSVRRSFFYPKLSKFVTVATEIFEYFGKFRNIVPEGFKSVEFPETEYYICTDLKDLLESYGKKETRYGYEQAGDVR